MRIGELSQRTGASVRSLRYYEEQGLLRSTRSPSGQRHYAEVDVARVVFMRQLLAAGLSSRTIAEVMPCVDTPSDSATDEAWTRLAEERAKLDAHIDELLLMRAAMDRLIERNRAHRTGDLTECSPSAPPSRQPALAPTTQWDDRPKAPAELTTPR